MFTFIRTVQIVILKLLFELLPLDPLHKLVWSISEKKKKNYIYKYTVYTVYKDAHEHLLTNNIGWGAKSVAVKVFKIKAVSVCFVHLQQNDGIYIFTKNSRADHRVWCDPEASSWALSSFLSQSHMQTLLCFLLVSVFYDTTASETRNGNQTPGYNRLCRKGKCSIEQNQGT